MTNDIDKFNKPNLSNKQYELYFEKIFADSITVVFNDKVVFKKFVKTIKSIEAAPEFCRIDNIIGSKNIIYMQVGTRRYQFKPIKEYQYYYFTKIGNDLGITYSNISREYY